MEEVNAVQNDPQISVRLQLGLGLDPTSISRIKDAFREAWKATTIMDDFDMEAGFKKHYLENKNTLKSMCSQLGISTNNRKINYATVTLESDSVDLDDDEIVLYNPEQYLVDRRASSTPYEYSSKPSSPSNNGHGCLIMSVGAVIGGVIGAAIGEGGGAVIGALIGFGLAAKIIE